MKKGRKDISKKSIREAKQEEEEEEGKKRFSSLEGPTGAPHGAAIKLYRPIMQSRNEPFSFNG